MDRPTQLKYTLSLLGITVAITLACADFWMFDEGSLDGWEALVGLGYFVGVVVSIVLAGQCYDLFTSG